MSLQFVLLGMLREPASGYDLKQRFQNSVRHFWAAELAQIYPLLARMEQQGLLTCHTVVSEQGPPRRVYQRTAAGLAALAEWLSQGPQLRSERLSWLAQVFFLDQLAPSQRLQFFQQLRKDFHQHLKELEAVQSHWRDSDPRYPDQLPDADFFPQLTLRLGIMKYQTIIQWCDESLQRLAARQSPLRRR